MEHTYLEPVVKFLIIGDAVRVAVSMASVALLVLLGLIFARRRVWWGAAICFALAVAPFVLHMMTVRSQDLRLDARAEQVAAFERTPLGPDYPRVLESELMPEAAGVFLSLGLFDAVQMYGAAGSKGERQTTYRWMQTAECEAVAAAVRRAQADPAPSYAPSHEIKPCLVETWAMVSGPRPDAVIMLRDGDTTLRRRYGKHRAGGAYELRLRRNGEDTLVDYWESPLVERPRTAAMGQSALESEQAPSERLGFFDFVLRAIPAT
jgi:hypothetical protein